MTEAFDGSDYSNATVSIIGDGVPRLFVETLVDGQAAWTYDIFFTAPHLANVPELDLVNEGTGEPQGFGDDVAKKLVVSVLIPCGFTLQST